MKKSARQPFLRRNKVYNNLNRDAFCPGKLCFVYFLLDEIMAKLFDDTKGDAEFFLQKASGKPSANKSFSYLRHKLCFKRRKKVLYFRVE